MSFCLFLINYNLCVIVLHFFVYVAADSESIRNTRSFEESCAVPALSHDRKISYHCDGEESDTCGSKEGYVPENTIAIISCKQNYFQEDETHSLPVCTNNHWSVPIGNCIKQCDKLTPINVDLKCFRRGKNISCGDDSTLLVGTKVLPTCKMLHKHSDPTSNYSEITCQDDGKWDKHLFSCHPQCGRSFIKPTHLIAYGDPEQFGDSPWHVAIYNRNKLLLCSGTIITTELILSAAHCFYDRNLDEKKDPSDFEVVVSKFSRDYYKIDNSNQKIYKIKEIRFSDKGYKGFKNQNAADIVILILQERITVSPTVLPVCIDWNGLNVTQPPPDGAQGKVVGWGQNEHGNYSEYLTTANLPFIKRENCLKIVPQNFKGFVTFDKFCAGSTKQNSARVLVGDSGGGLLFQQDSFYYLRGIVSSTQPSLTSIATFTDIADHISWIIQVRDEVEQAPFKTAFSQLLASYNQMKITGQQGVMKLYNLSERLKKEVIDHEKITQNWKSQAQLFHKTLRNSMLALAVKNISDAFVQDRLSTVMELGSDLVNTCYQCFNQIIAKVIDNIWSKIDFNDLLTLSRKPNGFCCIPELISIYTALFHKLQQNNQLNTQSSIQLAHRIKEVMDMENYPNVESKIRSQMEHVKHMFSKSVQSIAFSTKICIRNVAYNEYLYAAGPAYVHDEDRRYIFTWKGGDRYDPDEPGKFAWKLERNGDDSYEIINSQYKEHLYAGVAFFRDNDRRGVLSWRKGGRVIESPWRFEPEGDYVYIKNAHQQEYMFADLHEIKDDTRRYVFTYTPKSKTPDSKWEIIDCPNQ